MNNIRLLDSASCYDMEVEALQHDFIDMNADMNAALSDAERDNCKACAREEAIWEGRIESRRAALAALAGRFKSQENSAIAQYQAGVLEFERLNQREIARLRQRMPRPQRPPQVAPTPRPHRTELTRMCKPPAPDALALRQAQDVLTWLRERGIQQRHIAGQPFADELREGLLPGFAQSVPHEMLELLHLELSALPAAQWHTLLPAIARIVGLGAKRAPMPKPCAKQLGWKQWLASQGWRWLSSRLGLRAPNRDGP